MNDLRIKIQHFEYRIGLFTISIKQSLLCNLIQIVLYCI